MTPSPPRSAQHGYFSASGAVTGVLGATLPPRAGAPAPPIVAAEQNRLTREFLATVEDLGATVLRLNATIELGVELMREREPALLVETFCRGAQHIIGARYAACGMIERGGGGEIAHLHTCGLPADTAEVLRQGARQGSLFQWMMRHRCAERRRAIAGDMRRVDPPAQHPYIDSFLGIPIHGADGTPGWLYLAEKSTGGCFTDEDERLAATLCWQAGFAYQNDFVHNEAARKTVELEEHALLLTTQINEHEREQRALAHSEDRFRSIVAAVSEGIFIVSPAGVFIEVNAAGGAMFGYSGAELVGGDFQMISSNLAPYTQSGALGWVERARETDRPQRFEWHCKAKGGRLFWAEVAIRVAAISGQDTVLAIVRDVSDRKIAEAQLRQAQKMEAIGTLAGGMAHDINNCLVPIMSLSELVVGALPAGGRDRECIELIREAGGRIRDLVRRILVFSRHEEIAIAPIDLVGICAGSIDLLRATFPATIELRSQLEPEAAIIEGDCGQLQQIILNLCVNAADAIGDGAASGIDGGGVIALSLARAELRRPLDAVDGRIAPGAYYRLRVADNGGGMDEATLARIFEPFYTTKPPGKGTGLGLAMVHTIVSAHRGHLRATSRPGAGAIFEIWLPALGATGKR